MFAFHVEEDTQGVEGERQDPVLKAKEAEYSVNVQYEYAIAQMMEKIELDHIHEGDKKECFGWYAPEKFSKGYNGVSCLGTTYGPNDEGVFTPHPPEYYQQITIYPTRTNVQSPVLYNASQITHHKLNRQTFVDLSRNPEVWIPGMAVFAAIRLGTYDTDKKHVISLHQFSDKNFSVPDDECVHAFDSHTNNVTDTRYSVEGEDIQLMIPESAACVVNGLVFTTLPDLTVKPDGVNTRVVWVHIGNYFPKNVAGELVFIDFQI